MGFFKDFKRDFAQAVNELMPDPNEVGAEYDDEEMVNTFDEGDLMEVAPEDLLENLDDIKIENDFDLSSVEDISIPKEEPAEETGEKGEEDIFDGVPEAEIIHEASESDMASVPVSEDELLGEPELLQGEKRVKHTDEEPEEERANPENATDELLALDALDEENMMEHTEEALLVEPEVEARQEDGLADANLHQAVEDALAKQAEDKTNQEVNPMGETAQEQEEKLETKEEKTVSDITYITKGTSITGNITAEGEIDLIGNVTGDVSCDGKLLVAGTIKGNVNAGELYANAAKIEGEIHVEESVKVGVGSIVVGDIFAGSAVIAGAIKGDIDVQGPVIVDSTAVIMGNIKSRSVQINNGAVIEGMCSQCYSEIDVKSFFE